LSKKEVGKVLVTIRGHFDGKMLVLDESPPDHKPAEVLVTFIGPPTNNDASREILDAVLARRPVSIAPLRIKDLIAEGRQ